MSQLVDLNPVQWCGMITADIVSRPKSKRALVARQILPSKRRATMAQKNSPVFPASFLRNALVATVALAASLIMLGGAAECRG